MPRVWDVPVRDSTRVRDARVAAEAAAALAGLDERRSAAAALVATELATNLLKHAEGGQVLIEVVAPPVRREGGREGSRAVQIAAIDHGPGIADVPAALRDGFSTGRSLGAGLGTCRRLSDDFALHSVPGRGTVAVARVSTTPRGGEVPVRPEDGGFAGGQWPGGEPPFGRVACGGLTGHPAVSGEAPCFAGRTQGITGDPAPSVGRAPGTGQRPYEAPGQALPGTGTTHPPTARGRALRDTDTPTPPSAPGHSPSRTGAPVPQAAAQGLAGAGTPGAGSASRTAPSHGLADAGADPVGRTAPADGSPDSAAGPPNRSLPVAGVRAGGVNIPYGGAEYSGDAWAWVRAGDRVTLMLADGLGHGPEAARASSTAVAALHRWAHLSPAESLGRLHESLKGTRGAAVALAQLDLSAGRLRFAGIGNVGARLHTGGTWHALLSRPGIVGVHRPATLREEEADWTDDPLLILHTDGLPSRWTPPSGPELPAADPAVTAAVTIRDASSPARPVRDDTAVAVLTSTPPERP
ncbi:SpoIIE family protein phosphatase [Streptomyces luteogriseus]|uniref:SpoIIE family protein phosphatase n=1 Tax=Streptomyces luteogriseus TaxID=68233 RepID=UPI0037963889